MSLARESLQRPQDAQARGTRAGRVAFWLVMCCYLAGAIVLTWRLWADPAGRAQLFGGHVSHDVDLFAWFMRYDATAVSHGRLPALVTTALNAPEGVNLMWNTSFLLPGVVLAPVTLLAGPQVSLTIMLTLGFAGSAAALFLVLRRWGASVSAAALAGALYGFSPALLDGGAGHYHLQFAVLPPLIIDAVLRIITGRGHAVRCGIWLGLLASAQLFIGEELLVDTALAVLVLVVSLALSRPRTALTRAGSTVIGLATGAVVALLICGYALWVQFHGPLAEHGSPWPASRFRNHPADFVVPPDGLLFHNQASAAALAGHSLRFGEYLVAYLGWPLLVVLVIATVWFWRDLRVRTAAVTFWVLEIFSLGSRPADFAGFHYPGAGLPWHWLQHLPVLSQLLADRFSILADGAAAAVLAFSLDRARAAMPQASPWWRRVPTVVAVLALLPLIPVPLAAGHTTPVPAGWRAAFARLGLVPHARVLVIPGPAPAMGWQAATGVPDSLIGGYCVAPGPTGAATDCPAGRTVTGTYLNKLTEPSSSPQAPSRAQINADFAYWRPAAIVAVTRRGSPLDRFLTRLFGRPTVVAGRVIAWRRSQAAPVGPATAAGLSP